MIEIKAEITGFKETDRVLKRFEKMLLENEEMFGELIQTSRDSIEEAFQNEGASDGFPRWRPLSKYYANWKNKKFPNAGGILQLQGNLRTALKSKNAAASIENIKKTEAFFGVNTSGGKVKIGDINPAGLPYAFQHQTGTDLPERPFMRIGEEQINRFAEVVNRHIEKKLKDSGFKF